MDCTFSQARCHISLPSLQRNFARCGDPAHLMAVIKADAYGHGLIPAAKALEQVGARRFAIGVVDEGRALRDAGHSQKIVALMPPITAADWAVSAERNISPAVGSFEELERAKAAGTKEHPVNIVVKAETGMHRLGFTPDQIPSLIDALRNSPTVRPDMVLSHFATADVPSEKEYMLSQHAVFSQVSSALCQAFPDMERSLLNSAGGLAIRNERFDVIRPGITLYGGNPFTGTPEAALGSDFEWAMSLETPVLQVTRLAKGETVSYGRTYTAPRDMRLAVIGAGYATAVPRVLSNKLEVLLHGVRIRQVGRVCMSMIMLDVTDLPDVCVGDRAWLLGGTPAEGVAPITPQDWADALGTISYEVLCLVGSVNPRIYD